MIFIDNELVFIFHKNLKRLKFKISTFLKLILIFHQNLFFSALNLIFHQNEFFSALN